VARAHGSEHRRPGGDSAGGEAGAGSAGIILLRDPIDRKLDAPAALDLL
jgi:hypothetical protein